MTSAEHSGAKKDIWRSRLWVLLYVGVGYSIWMMLERFDLAGAIVVGAAFLAAGVVVGATAVAAALSKLQQQITIHHHPEK